MGSSKSDKKKQKKKKKKKKEGRGERRLKLFKEMGTEENDFFLLCRSYAQTLFPVFFTFLIVFMIFC
jgi:hypothetical protein